MDIINEDLEHKSRYVVGIDLGTTNSAVAFVDTIAAEPGVENFPVMQVVAPGELQAKEVLPSFLYEPAAGEFAPDALKLPWQEKSESVVGAFARDHGAAVPGRLVVSAKSWLSHSGVDRTAQLLPWHAAPDAPRLSPVDATARYLGHIRAAWNHAHPDQPLEKQDVIVTVPASFDEVARELTVEGAARAGLSRVVLLEEPQAAFYAWIYLHSNNWQEKVNAGQTILVCDVGGGTSDFTLIHVKPGNGDVRFHRVAVGDHLILGGDNLDLALAYHVEKKLNRNLTPRQFSALVRSCQKAKERLLGDNPPQELTINILGGGAAVIGGALQVTVNRNEVSELLIEGFLPKVEIIDKPASRRSGFQEFGLPYAADHAITRYLADFLCTHQKTLDTDDSHPKLSAARPDVILLNGGLFLSPAVRRRIFEAVHGWFSDDPQWNLSVLQGDRPELAVARGAAYYGLVRRGIGVHIDAGLARSYYIGVAAEKETPRALCLAPAGLREEESVYPDRSFELLIRQPVEFPLYASSVRTIDKAGELIEVDPNEVTALPAIRTVLKSGKKSTADKVKVNLHAYLTPIGTLELWCEEDEGDRRWRLQFDVRSATQTDVQAHRGTAEAAGFVDARIVDECERLIVQTFDPEYKSADPKSLIKRLENASDMERSQWPPSFLRQLWETLIDLKDARSVDPLYEARWLNLTGYSLRPGYGYAVDDWRVKRTWQLFREKVAFAGNQQCRAEWWVLWRRIAGGLSAGQQQALTSPLIAAVKAWTEGGASKKKKSRATSTATKIGSHELTEVWRLLGSCEHLPVQTKQDLGEVALSFPRKNHQVFEAVLWALARIGARVPMYGPLNELISTDLVEEWLVKIMGMPWFKNSAFCVMQLSRRTGDRYRDIGDSLRSEVIGYLKTHDAADHLIALVDQGGALEQGEENMVFGESLPHGLRI